MAPRPSAAPEAAARRRPWARASLFSHGCKKKMMFHDLLTLAFGFCFGLPGCSRHNGDRMDAKHVASPNRLHRSSR
jgi:hypothetical protein